jgi:hypothetical protein
MNKSTKMIASLACCALIGGCVLGVTGCSGKYEDGIYKGEYSYACEAKPGETFGAKVEVTVQNQIITAVKVSEDGTTYYNIAPFWPEGSREGDLGPTKAAEGYQDYINEKIVGQKASTIVSLKIMTDEHGIPKYDVAHKEAWSDYIYTGATLTSGRLLLAIQNALTNDNIDPIS